MLCPKCKGSGIVEKYKHVRGGRCYRCKGKGQIGQTLLQQQQSVSQQQPDIPVHEYRQRGSPLTLERGSRDWFLWKAAQEPDADWRRRWLTEAEMLRKLSIIERQLQDGEPIPYWLEAMHIEEERILT